MTGWIGGCPEPTQGPPPPPETTPSDTGLEPLETLSATVAAHTSGTVSTESRVRVAFSQNVADAIGLAGGQPLTFEPELDGTTRWTRLDELEFLPSRRLPPGQRYVVTLHPERIGLSELDPFRFTFTVLRQGFGLSIDGVDVESGAKRTQASLRGQVATEDVADPGDVEKSLVVKSPHGSPKVTWTHADNKKDHRFVVSGLPREDEDYTITLQFAGEGIGVKDKQEQIHRIPGLNTFAVLQAKAVQEGERHLEIRFSDPLREGQDLTGLVSVKGEENLRFLIDDNVLQVFGKTRLPQTVNVTIAPGILNASGYKLKQGGDYEILFERLAPAVRFVGKGTVVPSSDGLTVPIETANLRRVTVEALRVPGKNLPQFFQVNAYDGDNELKRVGRVIWKHSVDLGDPADLGNAWSRHGLDLTPLVQAEPSGMYRLRLSFERDDILYTCERHDGDEPAPPPALGVDDELGNWDDEQESSYWDSYEGNYWEAYEHRTDPCHAGYYRKFHDHDVAVTKNVLLSDLGLIAKRGTGGEMRVVVTDLKTATPVSNARVRVIDFQQVLVDSGRTGADGMVTLDVPRTPFLVIADARGQSGYLRLDDGAALSVAHFDVGGAAVAKGLKGLFYGERGVWRPGDEIFLTFVLHDRDKRLPEAHPVHFTLTDPQGKIVEKAVRKESNDGFYVFKLKTSGDAPTGNYTARVKVGGATFSHVLKVEAIMPNRLKIEMEPGQPVLRPGVALDVDLRAQWLHGALARNLKAEVEATLVPGRTSFPKFSEYQFDSPTRRYSPSSQEIFSGRLDEQGQTTLQSPLRFDGKAAGLMTAAFTTRVYEPSGAFSVDRHSVPFAPYDRYVGVRLPKGDKARGMLLTDTRHPVQLVVVDDKGEKVKEDVTVKVQLYKINWRWWWEKGEENLSDYASAQSHQRLDEATVTLKDGEGTWGFEIKYPDWGRYLVVVTDDKGGHQTGQVFYCDWPGWAGRAQKDNPAGATVLSLTTDKSRYDVGEEVVLTIPAAVSGRALVSLESGSKVVRAEWLQATGETLQHRFKVTPDMAPGVYAHVTLLQPHLQAKNDLPIRLYGITPIQVSDPATRLNPVVTVPESFEPGKVARLSVGEGAGRPMSYTLAIVDEGLLGLTRYKTPNPWDSFYAREALGVKTWDIYDEVTGAFGGKLESLLSIGGDGSGEDGGRQRANRFPPMVLFKGPFSLQPGETKDHELQLPPYVGAVRVMVVAGHDGAYGAEGKSVYVRKPLIVLPTLPRVVGPGEQVSLPAAVFALDDKIKAVTVEVETNDLLEVIEERSRKLTFQGPGDQIVAFELKVKDRLGVGKVKVVARGGGETAAYDVELQVRHPGEPVTDVKEKTLAAGESWVLDRTPLAGLPGTNRVSVEVSRVPPLDLGPRLDFLIHYPHGCVEQTTSSAFPQVYLKDLLDLDAKRRADVEAHVKVAISKLRGFQHPDGGFGYWPSDRVAHDWSSSYVGHFLLEARRAGYAVPSDMLARWAKHQKRAARTWRERNDDFHGDLTQAYRLYTLALAGAADIGAMNRLRESKTLSDSSRWRLAAAYQLVGQGATAKALISAASSEVKPYHELSGTFGSALRDQAMILETLVLVGDEAAAAAMARTVSAQLADASWASTHETAYGLVAMARWSQGAGTGKKVSFDLQHGERPRETFTSTKPLVQVTLPLSVEEQAAPQAVTVKNTSDGPLFARFIAVGVPAVGKEKAASQGLKVETATFQAASGGALALDRVAQGTDVLFKVTVTNTSPFAVDEIALTHVFPSGYEIRNERLDPRGARSGRFDYQDVRDDRVLTYFDLKQGESRTFEVVAHAAYLGRFYLPPVAAEAMYDETLSGRTKGGWIEVTSAPAPDEE